MYIYIYIVASGGTLPAKLCFANPFAKRLRAEKKKHYARTTRGLRAEAKQTITATLATQKHPKGALDPSEPKNRLHTTRGLRADGGIELGWDNNKFPVALYTPVYTCICVI